MTHGLRLTCTQSAGTSHSHIQKCLLVVLLAHKKEDYDKEKRNSLSQIKKTIIVSTINKHKCEDYTDHNSKIKKQKTNMKDKV